VRVQDDAGVVLHTHTAVDVVEPHRLVTTGGTVRAGVIVLATEAYTATFTERHRDLAPVYSLMVGSDALTAGQWDAVGLRGRPTFHDARHLVVYGQRTADGRIAFGGRGAPYHFGSRIAAGFDTDERVRARLAAAARELFPVLDDVVFPFHWGGPLGVARDWHCAVHFDRTSRLAFAGVAAGDGVATSNLAGRTLAELVTGQESDLCELPWVGHHSPAWEHEPWRWLGVNTARMAAGRADRAERSRRPLAARRAAGWRRVLATLSGR